MCQWLTWSYSAGEQPEICTFPKGFSPRLRERVHWSYWDDLKHFYGEMDMRPYISRLSEIFPEGVCDYTRSGVRI